MISTIRKATADDYEIIKEIEDLSFGVHIAQEEVQMIIEENYGVIYIASKDDKPIAYQAILYKEYDSETETFLQPILRERKRLGEKLMHDDVRFDSDKYVYFHLLGVIPEFQGQDVATEIKRFALADVKKQFPSKSYKISIRVNNLPSIRVNMKVLNIYLEGIKENDRDIIGSVETNFIAIGKPDNKPVLYLKDLDMFNVVHIGEQIRFNDRFLLHIKNGDEDELSDGTLKQNLDVIFKEGYIINGLIRDRDESYFHCQKIK